MKLMKVATLMLGAFVVSGLNANAADMQPRKLKFGTQSVGTTSYNRNSAMAEVMNKYLPEGWVIEMSPTTTGGFTGTLFVEAGKVDLAEGNNVPNQMLMAGEVELEGKKVPAPQKTNSFVAGTDYAYYTVMFTDDFHKKAGVDTLEEVIAKKIPFTMVTKAPGASGELGAAKLLEVLGASYDDIKKWGGDVYRIAPPQMADMLREGKADVSIDVISPGQPAMSELTMTKKMFFPQLQESTLKALAEKGYAPKVLKAGSWNGQDRDLNTMVNASAYVVSKDLPEEVVYQMTKAIVENKPELVKLVPAMEQYEPELSADPQLNGLPMHPGALRYYKEKGMIK